MDHKVNTMQWTAVQLKKKFDAYKEKFGDLNKPFKFFKDGVEQE